MRKLQSDALAVVPLSEETVESFYDGTRSGTAEQCLVALCRSHERLRYELEGMKALLSDAEKDLDTLRGQLALALALTDTGSPEFRAAFPAGRAAAAPFPRENVPGWRVVEKIREALCDRP